MILPPDVAAALGQLPFAGLRHRHSSYGEPLAEIQRLTAPSTASGVAAIGAHVEQLGPGPSAPWTREARVSAVLRQRAPQLVPIEELIRDDGVCQLYGIIGWAYV